MMYEHLYNNGFDSGVVGCRQYECGFAEMAVGEHGAYALSALIRCVEWYSEYMKCIMHQIKCYLGKRASRIGISFFYLDLQKYTVKRQMFV